MTAKDTSKYFFVISTYYMRTKANNSVPYLTIPPTQATQGLARGLGVCTLLCLKMSFIMLPSYIQFCD